MLVVLVALVPLQWGAYCLPATWSSQYPPRSQTWARLPSDDRIDMVRFDMWSKHCRRNCQAEHSRFGKLSTVPVRLLRASHNSNEFEREVEVEPARDRRGPEDTTLRAVDGSLKEH